MSHNVLIKNVKITSLNALRRAIAELSAEGVNVAFSEAKTFRTYQGQPNGCDYCISLPGERHDVGLIQQSDGSYLPFYDPWSMSRDGRGISCSLGSGDHPGPNAYVRATIGKLMQRYSTCVAEDSLALSGYWAQREVDANGDIQLTVEY